MDSNQYGDLKRSNSKVTGNVPEATVNSNGEVEAKQRALLAEWLNDLFPHLNLPIKISDEELRACLIGGTVLCQILKRLKLVSVNEVGDSNPSSVSHSENVRRFLASLDKLGIPRFEISDLEKGSMKPVLDCLLTLRGESTPMRDKFSNSNSVTKSGSPRGDASKNSPLFGEEKRKVLPESQFQRTLRSTVMPDPSTGLIHHVGHKFHEVFQLKQGRYSDLPAAKISEMMKSNSLDNAPTQSLLSVVNGILDESVEKKNGEIPHRVACLLRKVVQEIERRISTQAEHLRTQNNLFKAREDKYQSRIRVLETLAAGTGEETEIVMQHLQQIKTEQPKVEEKKKVEGEDLVKLMKEKDQYNLEISRLKQELEIAKKAYEGDMVKSMKDQHNLEISGLKQELEMAKKTYEVDLVKLMKEKDKHDLEISGLIQELEMAKKAYEGDLVKSMKDQHNFEISGLKQELEMAKKTYEADLVKLMKEKDKHDLEISRLKQELEMAKKTYEGDLVKSMKEKDQHNLEISGLKQELEIAKKTNEADLVKLMKEKDKHDLEISGLKQELEMAQKTYELRCLQMETDSKGAAANLVDRLKDLESLLTDSRNKVKELETNSELKYERWSKKEKIYQRFMEFQLGALRELRFTPDSIKQEILKAQKSYSDEFHCLGIKFKLLADAAENYNAVLAENRKLFNEVQDLKGNIRVYCRIRPFLRGQTKKQSTVEYIGENGELIVANPAKPGKEGQRMFKFNRVFGPASTQADVFSDTKPLIRSVLDGYNVCIFAYGQTGSGKTHTMSGPDGASEEDWGVNYRALNDLFTISQNRRTSITYEVGVQMVEIYNEQVRDLLTSDGSQKKYPFRLDICDLINILCVIQSCVIYLIEECSFLILEQFFFLDLHTLGIMSTSQPNGLAVPDATMQPVRATSDVVELMDVGLKNRAKGSTALNERSSRSHSVVTIHVRGKDLKTGVPLHGNLHLVDLAGSERVDRSEVTGDRLKEAQHINKSLSALGDVIFALAQKSTHVPYRNSKLTQVLQSSLGGQAKTLMFVQLNPDSNSFSESLSTLKFAERVSGVELGAAKSSKEGRDVRELMEQVASLKDTIAKKDDEIERLQLLKDLKNVYPGINGEKRGTETLSLSVATVPDGSAEHTPLHDGTQQSDNLEIQNRKRCFREGRPACGREDKSSVAALGVSPSPRGWENFGT
ncbi:hypothetical protein JRO89_XS13G0015100 [Xanthoceras sorbifolium]|uniref:Uncharacterized protein n=1 Tax=Xanthoceras sorbifolium TaxID=99658 RepID=A0ABQ8H5X3_9ROSI|nr:hypothetical protein JRO89_XS13G0015100 [Xanthoceras sorbifolium]